MACGCGCGGVSPSFSAEGLVQQQAGAGLAAPKDYSWLIAVGIAVAAWVLVKRRILTLT
jgi:hypothetical protein